MRTPGGKTKSKQTSQPRQTELRFPCSWGGRRAGAGRKRQPGQRRVPHRTRAKLAPRFPVHVTVRLRDGVRNLRNFAIAKILRRAFVHCCDSGRFRICQFSIQGNHIHLICEAADAGALAHGMQRWSSMVARAINRKMHRRGAVVADRYHSEVLRNPRQVRNTLCYVLLNARRHRVRIPKTHGDVDPFSSAWHFNGWRDPGWRDQWQPPDGDPPVARPRTWLLNQGWRRHGLLQLDETPAAGREVAKPAPRPRPRTY